MPFFENTTILCRDPYDFDNYSTTKIEIAFMSNLERPLTATVAAWPPGLLDRWDLQGRGGGGGEGEGADGASAERANTMPKQIFPVTASQSLRS